MSGHSKWSNIKRTKGKTDAERAKVFTKIGREISVAAKTGADPSSNSKLRDVINKARKNNMPNDSIQRAIKRASENNMNNYEEVIYEGYGNKGVAIMVTALTDNRNRTAGEVRAAFDKHGNGLGTPNSVSFMFKKIGELIVDKNATNEEALFEIITLAGADNLEYDEDENFKITTSPTAFSEVCSALDNAKIDYEGDIIYSSDIKVELSDEDWESLDKLIDKLEESDDVQDVYHNAK